MRFCFLVLVPTSIAKYQQIKLKVTQFLTVFVCSSYVLEIGRFFGVYHFDAFSESIWTGAWGSSYFHWGVIGLARKKLEPCFCSFALKSFQWTARGRVGESKIGLCICLALELQDLSELDCTRFWNNHAQNVYLGKDTETSLYCVERCGTSLWFPLVEEGPTPK